MRPEGAESTLSLPLILVLFAQAASVAPSAPPPPAQAIRSIDDATAPLTGFVPQGSYEQGVRGRIAQSQNLQGPLDGGWVVRDQAGAPMYRLQLVDPGYAGGALEGVWSETAVGGPMGTGFIERIERNAFSVTVRMAAGELVLTPRPAGGWSGELSGPGGRRAVTMTRP